MRKLCYIAALLLGTVSISAQSVDDMLAFVNREYADHNGFQTSLAINKSAKQFILSDQFGTFVVPMSNTAFRATEGKDDMLEIYCLDGSGCLTLDDNNYRYYSMKVAGADRTKMLDYLSRIRKEVYGSDMPSSSGGSSSYSQAEATVNRLLSRYNKYDSSISIDERSKSIRFRDKFTTLTLEAGAVDVKYVADSKYIQFLCKSGTECMNDKYAQYSISLKDGDAHKIPEMRELADLMSGALDQLGGGSSTLTSTTSRPSGLSTGGLVTAINASFALWNPYSTKFSVVGDELRWENKFSKFDADMVNLRIYANTENKWMMVECKSGDCIQSVDKQAGERKYKSNYSMTMGEAPDAELRAIEGQFERLLATATGGSSKVTNVSPAASFSGSKTDALKRINELYSQYNGYNTTWSLNGNYLTWTNRFDTYTVDLREASVVTRPDKQWVVVECDGGAKCIDQKSKGTKYYTGEYSMTVSNDAAIREIGPLFASLEGGSTGTEVSVSDMAGILNEGIMIDEKSAVMKEATAIIELVGENANVMSAAIKGITGKQPSVTADNMATYQRNSYKIEEMLQDMKRSLRKAKLKASSANMGDEERKFDAYLQEVDKAIDAAERAIELERTRDFWLGNNIERLKPTLNGMNNESKVIVAALKKSSLLL